MMVAIAVMVGSFRETVIYWVGQTLRADLYVGSAGRTQAMVSAAVERAVRQDPAVAAVDPYRRVDVPYEGGRITVAAGDWGILLERSNLLFKAPADAGEVLRRGIDTDSVIVSESLSIRHSLNPGDTLEIPVPSGGARFRIAAVYYDYSSDRGTAVMDSSRFQRHFGMIDPASLSVYLKPGVEAEEVRARILDELGDSFRIVVNTNRSLRREILRIFDSTFAVTYALEVIAVAVAIMGISSTLLTLILERRRELAVLRLVGADKGQVTRMVIIEATLLGGASQIIGLVIGLLLSLLLIYVVNVQSFGWTIQFHLPLLFLGQMTLTIVVATAIAGIYPARRACRFRPVEQMAEE
jgi:putative ABC transport system permease protein